MINSPDSIKVTLLKFVLKWSFCRIGNRVHYFADREFGLPVYCFNSTLSSTHFKTFRQCNVNLLLHLRKVIWRILRHQSASTIRPLEKQIPLSAPWKMYQNVYTMCQNGSDVTHWLDLRGNHGKTVKYQPQINHVYFIFLFLTDNFNVDGYNSTIEGIDNRGV